MSACQTQDETRALNEALFEKLASTDPLLVKEAVDAVNDFTRSKMREDGFARAIMPFMPISNDELDRQVQTDKPVKIVDKEPDSPAAITVGFATLPDAIYIRGPRYPVTFARILSPKFTKDTDELRTWIMDIRQVLSDNAIKDMLAEEDGKFISACNTAIGAAGTTNVTSGVIQHQNIAGGWTRDTLWDGTTVLPSTPSNLEVQTSLVNNLTIKQINKLTRQEFGGDFAQEVMKNGWTSTEFMGHRWIITIKKGIIANNAWYMFAEPKFLGKAYELEPTTMYIKREAFMLEFFSYETIGSTIGNTNAVARVNIS
jgi:hypothetical protein